jgi:hypothetical protein
MDRGYSVAYCISALNAAEVLSVVFRGRYKRTIKFWRDQLAYAKKRDG